MRAWVPRSGDARIPRDGGVRGRGGRGAGRTAAEARLPETGSDPYGVLGIARDAPPAAVREAYFRLVKLHPPEDDPEGFRAVSEAYRILSDPDERRRLDAAERLPPEVAAALQRAAAVSETDPKEAARIAASVLAKSAGSPTALFASACVLLRAGHPWEALSPLERLARAREPRADHLGALGRAYLLCGRPDDAARVLERSVAVDPSSPDAWLALSDVAQSRGDTPAALRVLDRGIRAAAEGGLGCLPLLLREIVLLVHLGRWEEMDAVAADVAARVPAGDADAARHGAQEFCRLAEESAAAHAYDAAKFAVDAARRICPDPGLDAWSERLAPHAAVSRECRMACLDERVAVWIRSILPPHFAPPIPDADWERLCRTVISGTSRRILDADREWATFRKLYPRGADATEDTWRQIRDAAEASRRGRTPGGEGTETGSALWRFAAIAVLAIASSAAFRTCDRKASRPTPAEVWNRQAFENLERDPLSREALDRIRRDAEESVRRALERVPPEDRERLLDAEGALDRALENMPPERRERILRMVRRTSGSATSDTPTTPPEAPK